MKFVQMDAVSISTHEKELKNLLYESYLVNFKLSADTIHLIVRDKIKELKKHVSNKNAYLFGKLTNEKLIAFVWFFEYEYLYEKRMHINQIIVDKEHRGKKISNELLQKVEEFAKKQDVQVIDLYVSTSNQTAMSLYKNKGFKTSREYLTKEL